MIAKSTRTVEVFRLSDQEIAAGPKNSSGRVEGLGTPRTYKIRAGLFHHHLHLFSFFYTQLCKMGDLPEKMRAARVLEPSDKCVLVLSIRPLT